MPIINSFKGSYYEYKFVTTFEETNIVGNIYFANYIVWQGKCREMFLHEYCPEILTEINKGLNLITLNLNINYLNQLYAFDEVVMKMYLKTQSASRLLMDFEYFKNDDQENQILIAKATQSAASMKEYNGKMTPVEFPESLFKIFEQYGL